MSKCFEKFVFSLLVFVSLINFSYSADGDKGSALIIIDMQSYFVKRNGKDQEPANVKKLEEVLKAQQAAIKQAKELKIPIIFIEYQNFGTSNPDLIKSTEGYENVTTFIKNTDGMFESYNNTTKQIEEFLQNKNIKTLIIAGANGGACVLASIQGSLARNFNVLAISTAIADFNYPEFVYPYKARYSFKTSCNDCSFKEIENPDMATLELTLHKLNNKNVVAQGLEDSKREPKSVSPNDEVKKRSSVQSESTAR